MSDWLPETPARGLWEAGGRRGTSVGNDRRLYRALAVEHGSRRLTWVHDESKRRRLFLKLLAALLRHYPQKRRIYGVLDNAAIHRAGAVQSYLEQLDGRIELRFLPPFCPDAKLAEWEWHANHAAVTVPHHHASLKGLLARTRGYFARRSRRCVRRHPRQPQTWRPTSSHEMIGHAGRDIGARGLGR